MRKNEHEAYLKFKKKKLVKKIYDYLNCKIKLSFLLNLKKMFWKQSIRFSFFLN